MKTGEMNGTLLPVQTCIALIGVQAKILWNISVPRCSLLHNPPNLFLVELVNYSRRIQATFDYSSLPRTGPNSFWIGQESVFCFREASAVTDLEFAPGGVSFRRRWALAGIRQLR